MTAITLGTTDGRDLALDLPTLIDTRMLVQAMSGAGKSWALRRILETTHGAVQQLVLDPEGEFATLRERYDYIIAGKGGDCAADPRSAKLLARRLLELGVSAVCDLYELKAHDRIRFVRTFLEALVEAPRTLRHPVIVVIDEAHLFCPEKGQAESAPAVIDLCTRGRKRGLCAVLATQRLSKLHKDAAAELRNVLVGATGLDIDQQRAGDVLGFGKAERLALRDLRPGEFYAYGPALSQGVVRVQIGAIETTHPKVGARMEAPPPPTEKVRALLAKVADLPAEAQQEARDNATLRKDLAETRRKLTLAEKRTDPVCDHERELANMHDAIMERDRIIVARDAELEAVYDSCRVIAGNLDESANALNIRAPRKQFEEAAFDHGSAPIKRRATVTQNVAPRPVRREAAPRAPMSQPVARNGHHVDAALSSSQQRILDTLAVLESIGVERPHKSIVAVFAGVSPTSGGYFNNLGRLRSMGLIDYPEASAVALTDDGRASATPGEEIASLAELHEAWCRRVSSAQAAIIRVAVEVASADIGKDELAERIGVSPTSGGYFNNLGRLRSLGAIDYPAPGRVAATALLFPEGLA